MTSYAPWYRFKEVTSHILGDRRLFRASSPNYIGFDESKKLDDAAVAVLTRDDLRINKIISLNRVKYSDEELAQLKTANISYLHIAVADYTAPTKEQLKEAFEFYKDQPDARVLVHCGYGHGRTGTCVTALQLHATRGAEPTESEWRAVNCVETERQIEVLREIRDGYKRES